MRVQLDDLAILMKEQGQLQKHRVKEKITLMDDVQKLPIV
jgi:hypothetical protein